MSARGKARKRALDVLYEADVRGQDPRAIMTSRAAVSQHPLNAYTVEIVDGVCQHSEQIDELLATYASGWTVERMPVVDRNLLRIGAWELLWGEVADGVAIAEAVRLAQELSTDDSPPFVNGLLSRLAEVRPYLALDR